MWLGLVWTAISGSSAAPAAPTTASAGRTTLQRSRSATTSQTASIPTAKKAK